jgi:hypothetical protein
MRPWRLLCLVLVVGGLRVEAGTVKLLVAVGNNLGNPDDAVLQFARADAERVASVFVELGGVDAARAVLVLDQPAEGVRRRVRELSQQSAELTRAGDDVVLMIYVSAHASQGVLHLSGTHLPVAELRALAERSAARVQVIIVDACDSGATGKMKGGRPAPEYEVAVERVALEGQVFISSSGPSEPSQEWVSLAGSLFTHHLVTGLRGDADREGDGRVTLAEAYSYAYRRTVVDATKSAQHPSFELALTGSGELVLTEPSKGRSALVFPMTLQGHYVIASQPRPDVMAEFDKRAGAVLRLAVPPGRYLLRKRLGGQVGVLSVELPWGGEHVVDEARLERRAFTEVAEKGGALELQRSSVLAQVELLSEPLAVSGARWRAGVGYRRTFGGFWLAGVVSVGHASYGGELVTEEVSGALGGQAGWRWFLTPVVLQAGLSLEGVLFAQAYQRVDQAAYAALGIPNLAPRQSLGLVVGPVLGLEIPLPVGFFLMASVVGQVRLLPSAGQPPWTLGVSGRSGIGWRF